MLLLMLPHSYYLFLLCYPSLMLLLWLSPLPLPLLLLLIEPLCGESCGHNTNNWRSPFVVCCWVQNLKQRVFQPRVEKQLLNTSWSWCFKELVFRTLFKGYFRIDCWAHAVFSCDLIQRYGFENSIHIAGRINPGVNLLYKFGLEPRFIQDLDRRPLDVASGQIFFLKFRKYLWKCATLCANLQCPLRPLSSDSTQGQVKMYMGGPVG
jgi:hypothetical protein